MAKEKVSITGDVCEFCGSIELLCDCCEGCTFPYSEHCEECDSCECHGCGDKGETSMKDPETYGEIVAADYEEHGNPFEWIDGEPPVKATAAKRVPVKPAPKKVCRPTGIRCGKCQNRHATVADVRACYGN